MLNLKKNENKICLILLNYDNDNIDVFITDEPEIVIHDNITYTYAQDNFTYLFSIKNKAIYTYIEKNTFIKCYEYIYVGKGNFELLC